MSKKSKNKIIFQTLEQLKKTGAKIYALIYCRVSSDRQARDGNGLESQEQRCTSFAEHNGYIVEKEAIFKDASSGGGEYTSRPKQVELLNYIDKHPHKNFVVVIDDISRLARDVQAHFKFRFQLTQRGVEVVSPNFNFEDSPEGELVEGMMAMVSQYHRKGNTRQVVQKQKARLMQGLWPFPRIKAYKMIPNPEYGKILTAQYPEAQYLKEALEGFAMGIFLRKIDACKFLVEKGYWKTQRPEKYIDKFKDIAKNVINAGFIEYPEWEVPRIKGKHEGIISLETFELLQKRLKKEDSGQRMRTDVTKDFWARGLVCCDDCGEHITAGWSTSRGKRFPYYKCQNHGCISYGKSIPRSKIESALENILKRSGLKDEVTPLVKTMFNRVWNDEVSKYEQAELSFSQQKKKLEEKIKDLSNLVVSSKSDLLKKTYETQLEKTAKEMEEMESNSSAKLDLSIPYGNALNKAVGLLKSPYSTWIKFDIHEQHRLFYFIFEEKLPYNRISGYRTDKIPSAIRLFEEFAISDTQDVEMGEIESPCRRFS